MSLSFAYDVDPENLVDVGFNRSGVLWAYKEDTDTHLSPQPEYGSDCEPNEPVCLCGWDSSSEGSIPYTKTEALDSVEPLDVCGPNNLAAGPSVVPCEAAPLLELVNSEWVPINVDDEDEDEDDLDSRVLYIEKEEAARFSWYEGCCLQAWLTLASHSLHTDVAGREAFCLRPNWGLLETIINSALANSYTGPGDPPRMMG